MYSCERLELLEGIYANMALWTKEREQPGSVIPRYDTGTVLEYLDVDAALVEQVKATVQQWLERDQEMKSKEKWDDADWTAFELGVREELLVSAAQQRFSSTPSDSRSTSRRDVLCENPADEALRDHIRHTWEVLGGFRKLETLPMSMMKLPLALVLLVVLRILHFVGNFLVLNEVMGQWMDSSREKAHQLREVGRLQSAHTYVFFYLMCFLMRLPLAVVVGVLSLLGSAAMPAMDIIDRIGIGERGREAGE
jgi:hypothetical protein